MSLPSPAEIASALIAREEMPPEKGDIGPQGMDGKAGEFGPPGPQGAKGDPGRNGTNGSNGNVGPKGPQGNGGPRGPKGEKGDKGDEGERGPIGPMGPTGAVGSGKALFPRPGGSSGSGLPAGGSVGQVVTNTAPGAGTWQNAAGGVANPLTADLDVGGFLVRGANLGADKGGLVQADAAVDVGQGGDVTVTGGEGNSTDGTGGEGTFEGGNGWKGGIGQLVGGASTGAGQDGANVLLTGGASFDAYGGEAQILGGTANGATGGGGDARIQGGDSQGSGVAAQIVVGGRPETSGNGLLEVKTNNSTGAASQFLGSNGSGKVVWATLAGLSGSAQTYTETNVTTDRAFNANATSIDELADVLGTLIVDLRARGVVA